MLDKPAVVTTVADVLAVGEVMGLLDPTHEGPLEDAGPFTLRIAGAEANVLISLARLGHSTALVTAVGRDPIGRLVTRTLTQQGVDARHIHVDGEAPTGVFFKERFADGLRRVHYYRKGSAASRLDAANVQLGAVPPKVFVLSGLSLGIGGASGLAAVARETLSELCGSGTTTVFDANLRPDLWDGPAARDDFASIKADVDVLLAGRDELAVLVPDLEPQDAARRLCAEGMSGVIVKDGAQGAVVFEQNSTTVIDPYPVNLVVDPIGAGDAFAAGVVCGVLQGWSLPDGARLGALLGACAVTAPGDWEGIPVDRDPLQLLADYVATVTRGDR